MGEEDDEEDNAVERKRGGTVHSPVIEQVEETGSKRKSIIRT